MNEQKSEGAHLLRKGNPDGTGAQVLRGLSTGSAMRTSITANLEWIETIHEQLVYFITPEIWSCKTRCSRVQYNIDVVKRTPKLQVRHAV